MIIRMLPLEADFHRRLFGIEYIHYLVADRARKAKSFFKYDLTYIDTLLLYPELQSYIDIFKFLSCI